MGINEHQSSRIITDEWLTPPEIINALGPFDLDPCAPVKRPWPTASKHFTIEDNGLLQPWEGFIWCNPPYGNYGTRWMERMAMHNNGIALIFARTETFMFHRFVWNVAESILFIQGRITFYRPNGIQADMNGGAPSVLIGYGMEADERLKNCGINGKYIKIK